MTEGRFDIIPYDALSPEAAWKRLGKGSFGCVYKGEYLGIPVAIKEVLDSDEYPVEKYFQREITIMQEARHPNIVQFIGLSLAPTPAKAPTLERNGSSFIDGSPPPASSKPRRKRILILSEYLEGGNLRSYIADTSLPFPWRHRLSFAIDIARAVAYLHARDCMHRDLKGENLLITENQRIKVCDFGFARIAPRNEAEQTRLSYCGTDGYMSPEIITSAEFDIRTDIFSFGIILAEIIGRTLADSDVFKRYAPDFGIDIDEIEERASPGCPPDFISVAAACCAPEPDDRPTILGVLESLRRIERNLVEAEQATLKPLTHVGTIKFSAEGGTVYCRNHAKRPSIGRIPSFKGQVSVPSRGSFSNSELEVAREGLEHPAIVSGEEKWLEDMPDSPAKVETREKGSYSTAVFRASRSNKSPSRSGSSILTVRPTLPQEGVKVSDDSSDSLPTIPSAWIREYEEEQAAKRGAVAADCLTFETPVGQQRELPAEQPSQVGSIATFQTARTNTPSIAAATVNAPLDHFDHSVPVVEMEMPVDGFLHRFSLVKPTWLQLFWGVKDGNQVCDCCRRRFGVAKAYFKCDDCKYRSHPKCADAAPADCLAGLGVPAPLANAQAKVSTSSLLAPPKASGLGKLGRKSSGK